MPLYLLVQNLLQYLRQMRFQNCSKRLFVYLLHQILQKLVFHQKKDFRIHQRPRFQFVLVQVQELHQVINFAPLMEKHLILFNQIMTQGQLKMVVDFSSLTDLEVLMLNQLEANYLVLELVSIIQDLVLKCSIWFQSNLVTFQDQDQQQQTNSFSIQSMVVTMEDPNQKLKRTNF